MKQRHLLRVLLCSTMLAGCHSSNSTVKKESTYHCRNINYYDYTKPVPYTEEAIDASYYANTFFAGDSRMGSLYLYTPLRDYGAEVWYCESMSLYRIYDMLNPDMFAQFQENTLYSLLTTTQKKNIYIWLGINEIRLGDWDGWKNTYGEVIDDIRKHDPECSIYLMSSYKPEYISDLIDEELNQQLTLANEAMAALASEKHVYYYNTEDGMIDEANTIKDEYVWDGLHLNADGANALLDSIAHHVVKEETYVKKICE